MSEAGVRFERQGSTAVVTLDNPATRNALTPELKEGLAAAIAKVKADPEIRAVVLTGANGAFCAGGDLRGIAAAGQLESDALRARMHGTHAILRELLTLDRPVIAAVDGAAYGAGFSLALAADFVLVTPRARFSMVFMRMGLVPDCGATYTLPRVVGAQRARELFLSAREVGAQEALSLGIAMEQHEADRLLPRALALADSFAAASPLAVSLVKRIALDPGALDAALENEANAQALCFQTTPHRQAVQRFFDKQPLAFQWPLQEE
ncbi:enoyl-CoA hydratase/isomerase family protein [Ramlibacter sp. AN1133]|uniref:enoyl-CoA hydratase/isomerase family protein n=1 Tax=Ramlibacter sp. AN1133 TaxID=3133429 RepID=UPI0030BEFD7B